MGPLCGTADTSDAQKALHAQTCWQVLLDALDVVAEEQYLLQQACCRGTAHVPMILALMPCRAATDAPLLPRQDRMSFSLAQSVRSSLPDADCSLVCRQPDKIQPEGVHHRRSPVHGRRLCLCHSAGLTGHWAAYSPAQAGQNVLPGGYR